jgi:glycosyltransferase involved in cell wall biosynthesis
MFTKMKKIKLFIQFSIEIITIYKALRYAKNIFIFPFYHTGGAEKVHLDIVKTFPKKDNIVIFTSESYNNHFLSDFEKNAKILHLHKYNHNYYFRKLTLKILTLIKNQLNTTVFGCNNKFFYDILHVLPTNVKRIDLVHAFTSPDPGGMEIYSLNKVSLLDKRMVINHKTKNDFIYLYKENKISEEYINRIKIIDLAVQTPDEKPEKNKLRSKLQVIYCGRISKEKRVNLIVHIANLLGDLIELKIYGHKELDVEGIDKYYQKNILNHSELTQIYQDADILLITSYREGFPVVIKEAMSNGVVCISTNVGSISEHVITNENGFIVENNDENLITDRFVEIISNLLNNRDLLNRLSSNAYNYASANFDLELFHQKIKNLINK